MEDEIQDQQPTTEVEVEVTEPAREPETDWQAEAKKWEKRSKANHAEKVANATAATELAELRKTLDEAEQDRAAVTAAESTARLEMALDHGLTRDDAALFLHGDAETMGRQAKRLQDLIGATAGPRRPAPTPGQGVTEGGDTPDRVAARRLQAAMRGTSEN